VVAPAGKNRIRDREPKDVVGSGPRRGNIGFTTGIAENHGPQRSHLVEVGNSDEVGLYYVVSGAADECDEAADAGDKPRIDRIVSIAAIHRDSKCKRLISTRLSKFYRPACRHGNIHRIWRDQNYLL
ncbi:hypothetical protein AB4144_33010, partial [Rhizobiaceae sp. 2RAB30]